jgi:hypothetical protein
LLIQSWAFEPSVLKLMVENLQPSTMDDFTAMHKLISDVASDAPKVLNSIHRDLIFGASFQLLHVLHKSTTKKLPYPVDFLDGTNYSRLQSFFCRHIDFRCGRSHVGGYLRQGWCHNGLAFINTTVS